MGGLLGWCFNEIPHTGLRKVGDTASPPKQKAGDLTSPCKRVQVAPLLKERVVRVKIYSGVRLMCFVNP